MRPIDGDALIDELRKAEEGSLAAAKIIQAKEKYSAESIAATSFSVVRDVVNDAPTIDPVKHGRWLNFYGNYSTAECSRCESCFEVTFDEEATGALWEEFKNSYKFCPKCGAKMDADA